MTPTNGAAPLVSVVIATYRYDDLAFLREAVSSMQEQTYEPIEVLVVLDGDVHEETQDYLDATTASDARVRLLRLDQNVGPALARNAGIAATRGEYIAILDADDRAMPERLREQWLRLTEAGADLLGSQYRMIDASGVVVGEKRVPLTPDALRRTIGLFNPIANSTVFARAEILKRFPYRDVDGQGTACFGEDYDLWVTLLLNGCVLSNHPEFLVEFRTTPDFLDRRRGWRIFRTDLRTKFRALRLYPLYQRPFIATLCLGVSAARLLPGPAVRALYGVRNALRFRGE